MKACSEVMISSPAIEEGVPEKLDDLIRAAAENECSAADSQLLRERFAQIKAAAIGIKMRAVQRGAHRRQRFGRRPEGIFVRGELDDFGRHQRPVRAPFPRLAFPVRKRRDRAIAGWRYPRWMTCGRNLRWNSVDELDRSEQAPSA